MLKKIIPTLHFPMYRRESEKKKKFRLKLMKIEAHTHKANV